MVITEILQILRHNNDNSNNDVTLWPKSALATRVLCYASSSNRTVFSVFKEAVSDTADCV